MDKIDLKSTLYLQNLEFIIKIVDKESSLCYYLCGEGISL